MLVMAGSVSTFYKTIPLIYKIQVPTQTQDAFLATVFEELYKRNLLDSYFC